MIDTREKEFLQALIKDRTENANVLEKPSMKGVQDSVVEKYSDQAHFVYELLQNADDAFATAAHFELKENELLFTHNGTKKFTITNPLEEKEDAENGELGDVNSICSLANSSKKNTPNKIGKFGVGFKAVFQYTETPHIFSDEISFVIERFIVPKPIEYNRTERKRGETLFMFPFNHAQRNKSIAYEDIKTKLNNLIYPTLFLSNIKDLTYKFCGQDGIYVKSIEQEVQFQDITAKYIRLEHIISENGKEIVRDEKLWLFSRGKSKEELYSIGFFIDDNGKLKDSSLPAFCFFPTKEVTNLKFIMHAPFLLTDSREGIKAYEQHNKDMIDKLTILSADALECLKEIGVSSKNRKIDDNIIELIPYNSDKLSQTDKISFSSFYDKIKSKLSNELVELLPAKSTYVSANISFWSSYPEITNIFDDSDLEKLVGVENARFVFCSIGRAETMRSTPQKSKYIDELGVTYIDEDKIINKITAEFIESKELDWLHEFYKWLNATGHRTNLIKDKPIFLNQNKKAVAAYNLEGQSILFLSADSKEYQTICMDLLNNEETKLFVEKLGIKAPELKDEIYNKIVPLYEETNLDIVIDHNYNFNKFFAYYCICTQKESSNLILTIKGFAFLASKEQNSSEITYEKAENVYFADEDLLQWFQTKKNTKFFNMDIYANDDKEDELRKFLLELGVAELPRILSKEISWNEARELNNNRHFSNYTYQYSFNIKYIDGLSDIINEVVTEKNTTLSKFVFEELCQIVGQSRYYDFYNRICGVRNYFYYSPRSENFDSENIHLIRDAKWLVNNEGDFACSKELYRSSISNEYSLDSIEASKLLEFLNIVNEPVDEDEQEKQIAAEKLGIDNELIILIDELKKEGQSDSEIKDILKKAKKSFTKPSFPISSPVNPNRRDEKIKIEGENAPTKEYETRERSVRISNSQINPSVYLIDNYTNENEEMICQICQEEMPFKKKNGKYYFESVEIFDNKVFKKEHEFMYLALCPTCAAKYNEYIKNAGDKNDDDFIDIMEQITNYNFDSDNFQIDIKLDDNAKIRFTEKHLSDVKSLINCIGKN